MARRINIDMDHVVADFNRHYAVLTGVEWTSVKDAKARWDKLVGKEEFFFANLPAYEGAKEFVKAITELARAHGLEVRFLTAVPRLMPFPTAPAEKCQWVREKLDSQLEVVIGPYAPDKQKHCRPGDILIDDNYMNIDQWRAAGGVGILHTDLAVSLAELRAELEKEI